ncbi:EAL and HDOD domain-containing protein [Rheinheimera maricola]|uniref:EAL domain-containing protein n=1 Tax=Rheinheimera maricola TaxID=2793282 RepID=A0ABS7X898_9GAMM|nr:EAL domain-containing protein [Rheinheimera maricola]MBZ9611770.1 EAL domain-containing protein [Rheinheimera maricola]
MVQPDSSTTGTLQDVQSLFAAQPIFDQNDNRVAVELLYRSDCGVTALELGDNLATTEIVYNLCSGVSAQIAQYNAPVFINVCADFLLSGSFLPLEPDKVVIELVERITPTEELVASVAELKRRGFRFALDDFEFTPAWEPLIALADIIKVDILNSSVAAVFKQRKRLAKFDLTWLAERVETTEQYQQYKMMGFDLFQGYFLARPELVIGKKVPVATLKLAHLIDSLFQAEPDIAKLSAQLNDEPTLVIGMLRIANSPLYRKTREVSSVKELIVRLGLDVVKKWLLMFAVLNNCSPAAASLILTRAYTTQQLAESWQLDETQQNQYFLTALISGVDVMFGVLPAEFVTGLNLAEPIRAAIIRGEGDAARAVELVRRIEQAYSMKMLPDDVDENYFSFYNQQQFQVQEKFRLFGGS